MRVTVRLFARLKDEAGTGAWDCDLAPGASVADVWRAVTSRYPALEPFGGSVTNAVNADFAKRTTEVHDGDEVAFLPPVSGGDEPDATRDRRAASPPRHLTMGVETMMTPQVLEKLKSVAARYEDLARLLSDPAVQSDATAYRTHAKALAEVEPLVEHYHEHQRAEAQLAEAREVAASGDPEMKALAQEEIEELEKKLARIADEVRVLLIPRDPNDDRNILLEIRAGTGGDEAALFAADLFRMYSRYAERHGWKVDVLSTSETGVGGLKEVIASIEGKGVYGRFKHESGVHRVQRVPRTEASGRIHTSTSTVAVLPEAEEVDVQIDPKDLRIDTFCSSGPGGQSVNTTYSAIRITHLPTNTVVSQQDEKSQIKNRQKAMKVLRSRLYEMEMRKQQEAIAKERRGQVGTGERSEKIRTYNFKESRITDHRVNFTMHQLQNALEGDLDPLIDQMVAYTQAEQLKQATEPEAAAP